MPENNQILSVEGQLIGMPTAGPESFSQQQLDYLKRALGVDETVLFDSATAATSGSFSEAITNFEKIRVYGNRTGSSATNNLPAYTEVYLRDGVPTAFVLTSAVYSDKIYTPVMVYSLSSSSFSLSSGSILNMAATPTVSTAQTNVGVLKVVGVGRIAGGN